MYNAYMGVSYVGRNVEALLACRWWL